MRLASRPSSTWIRPPTPSLVEWLRRTVKVPVVTGLPYGHVRVKATLPIGAKVGIATEDGMAHLLLREHA